MGSRFATGQIEHAHTAALSFHLQDKARCAELRIVGMGGNHKAIEHRFLREVHMGVVA
jgi:hypothetical protein